MLENFIFENHLGQKLIGLENGVYLNSNDLRDYSWNFDTLNGRISRFYKAVKARKIPLIVYCNSDEEAVEIKNRLFELSAVDIEARIPGKIYVGDYYLHGYITDSKKTDYNLKKRLCRIELTFTSDDDYWYSIKKHIFRVGDNESGSIGGNTDYPYDYAYDYALLLKGQNILCNSVGKNAFQLTIFGEAVNPAVIIGGHTYAINGTIGQGDQLTIDSLTKTITLQTAYGQNVNWFDKRSREQYIFEPIPAGLNSVSWLGTFNFDLNVIEKRSEPKWT